MNNSEKNSIILKIERLEGVLSQAQSELSELKEQYWESITEEIIKKTKKTTKKTQALQNEKKNTGMKETVLTGVTLNELIDRFFEPKGDPKKKGIQSRLKKHLIGTFYGTISYRDQDGATLKNLFSTLSPYNYRRTRNLGKKAIDEFWLVLGKYGITEDAWKEIYDADHS
ncbi:MAG: hypothetical protein K9M51_00145 [Candidatus Gracilibacteria bacterium]|nr:hypothetical protein [Candidatus Gracilibacteria bacterium]